MIKKMTFVFAPFALAIVLGACSDNEEPAANEEAAAPETEQTEETEEGEEGEEGAEGEGGEGGEGAPAEGEDGGEAKEGGE